MIIVLVYTYERVISTELERKSLSNLVEGPNHATGIQAALL